MLAAAVAPDGQRTLLSDYVPEITACIVPLVVAVEFGYALEAYHFRYLSVGMHIVKAVLMVFHRRKQLSVGEAASAVQIASVMRHGVCVSYHFVHTPMFIAEHELHLFVAESGCYVHRPVAELQEEPSRILVAAI